MTKIKNTKKGMAKKTLSISLAVAMLATSNVPVWAAEFTDGTDAAFTSEAPAEVVDEAPVVEEETEAPSAEYVGNGDIKLTGASLPTEATWSLDGVNVSGTVTDKDGNQLSGVKFGWRVDGETTDFITGNLTSENLSSATLVSQDLINNKEVAGKTIALHIYSDANENDFDVVVGKTLINKCSINDVEIILNKAYTEWVYNGREYLYGTTDETKNNVDITGFHTPWDTSADGVTPGWTWDATSKYFIATGSTGAVNAGDEFTVTVTAKAQLDDGSNNPYTGTANVSKTIQRKAYASGDIIGKYEKNTKYEYTGAEIKPELSKITLTESKYDKNTNPTGLSGMDLTAAVDHAVNWGLNNNGDKVGIGKKDILVYWDNDKLTNYTAESTTGANKDNVRIDDAFEVVARDLNKCTANVDLIPAGSLVSDIVNAGKVHIYDAAGNELSLAGTDYELIVMDPANTDKHLTVLNEVGKYSAAIIQKGSNTTGKIENITIQVDAATMDVASEKTVSKEFTGEEIKPSKSDFGALKVKLFSNPNGETTHTFQPDQWEILRYEANTNVGTGYAVVKVKDSQIFKDKEFKVPFAITPLKVTAKDIDVTDRVIFDKTIKDPADYNVTVKVTAKGVVNKDTAIELKAEDFTVTQKFESKNAVDHKIATTVKILNKNYIYTGTNPKVAAEEKTVIKKAALQDSFIKMDPTTYTYTGGKIRPSFKVYDDTLELVEGEDYKVDEVSLATNVGEATLKIVGLGDYKDSTATATYTITKAPIDSVKVIITGATYTGHQVRPSIDKNTVKVMLGDNNVTSQFDVAAYGENINAGKEAGSLTLKVLNANGNFEGTTKEVKFDIAKAVVGGTLTAYDAHGAKLDFANIKFKYDGTAKELDQVKFTPSGKFASQITENDYEIKYANNTYGDEDGKATVYVAFKEDGNFTGNVAEFKDFENNTVIKGAAVAENFEITSLFFDKTNVTVKNAVYAGGLPVKPEVIVQLGGKTLVEGKDYELINYGTHTEVTAGKPYSVMVKGINGYRASGTVGDSEKLDNWGIDKQTLADCDVTVNNGVATVYNGSVKVPASEYTVTKNDNGTYTVAAKSTSKNYVGSQTVVDSDEIAKPGTPMISRVDVTGNKATVVLSGNCDGATGYDYVISTDRDCITNKDYYKVNKNKLTTTTPFTYVEQGTYYAYCHAWTRDENGKKVFSEWSNPYPFVISAITPAQPVITNVKVKGSTVTVTYTGSAHADGYDVVLGSKTAVVNDEKRPVEYGTFVKKNQKSTTVTFKNVKKGTYYVGLHAFNRTSEDGKKVFSPWSQTKTVKVR